MSQPERTRVPAWTRLQSFAVGKCKRVQLSIERRSFEHKLERIVRIALANQSVGLPAGHPSTSSFDSRRTQRVQTLHTVGISLPICSKHRSPQSGS